MIPVNDKGNRYALSALTKRRGELATEIATLERQLRHRKELKVHIDATLKLLDPAVDLDKIKKRRPPDKRVKLFRAGELGRMILDAIRRAGGSVSTGEIVTAIIAAGGHGDGVRPTVGPRVRSNLGYLERRGKVVKTGTHATAKWRLA